MGMGKKSKRTKKVKPPVAIEVSDILNLARLAMSRVDVQPLFWYFKWKRQPILGYLSSIPYWYGNLPIFAYTKLNCSLKGYIAYMSVEREEVVLTDSNDDNRYMYGAVVETEDEPPFIMEALSGRSKLKENPVIIKAGNINSLIRMLMILSDTNSSPPLWYFEFKGKHLLGLIAPFFDYYDANALPVFFYVESDTKPPASFIRYISLKTGEEISYVPCISDMKYFYGRIVNVKSMPFFTSSGSEGRK
ncbi:MAG: hypothetical protein B9J98_07580 [Candidatus Terraquivivens tikiterensis]|uniref:Uncharacterized protein n=1 Tax=Candidatus Terraquivivens tikiterensis TaxID=1980982 RepID=A0A2R7Y0T6_9ARCH|nr:MAG: hypothetical protein B9J98_07580 [Candidatus Terraquivivens tikiterensis]